MTRMIYEMLTNSRSGIKWSKAVAEFWPRVVDGICEMCLRKLFNFKLDNVLSKEAREEVNDILLNLQDDQSVWSTLLYDHDFANVLQIRVKSYEPTEFTRQAACTCSVGNTRYVYLISFFISNLIFSEMDNEHRIIILQALLIFLIFDFMHSRWMAHKAPEPVKMQNSEAQEPIKLQNSQAPLKVQKSEPAPESKSTFKVPILQRQFAVVFDRPYVTILKSRLLFIYF